MAEDKGWGCFFKIKLPTSIARADRFDEGGLRMSTAQEGNKLILGVQESPACATFMA